MILRPARDASLPGPGMPALMHDSQYADLVANGPVVDREWEAPNQGATGTTQCHRPAVRPIANELQTILDLVQEFCTEAVLLILVPGMCLGNVARQPVGSRSAPSLPAFDPASNGVPTFATGRISVILIEPIGHEFPMPIWHRHELGCRRQRLPNGRRKRQSLFWRQLQDFGQSRMLGHGSI